MGRISTGVLAVLAATLTATGVIADDKPVPGDAAQAVAENAVAESSGLKAVRDKKTGKLRAPNPNEIREMEAAEQAAREASGDAGTAASETVVVEHAGGMRSAKLGPEYLISLQGKRADDGTIEKTHANDDAPADQDAGKARTQEAPTE